MSEHPDKPSVVRPMSKAVAEKQQRRLAARRQPERTIWFGLGMFGLVGWSIAIPALIGVSFGLWIDRRWPSRYSWTLMLLLAGVGVGCFQAWRWVHCESELDQSIPTESSDEIPSESQQ